MKKSRAGQGKQITVNVYVDEVCYASVVFGSESGHPFSNCWKGDDASTSVEVGNVLIASALLSWCLLTDDNYTAVLEFGEQLAAEAAEREGVPLDRDADDGKGNIPF